MAVLAVAGSRESDAHAAAAFPGDSRSHYVTGTDRATAATAGRRDAVDAVGLGLSRALVILDFGDPADADGGVRLADTGTPAGVAAVRAVVRAFARGWTAAQPHPRLVLVLGVTNSGPAVGAGHGRAWGRLVDLLARDLPVVDVRGGLDAELEYAGPAATKSWVTGFLAASRRPYVDFGSCTCPPYSSPLPRGWRLADVAAVAAGGGRAVVVPQIYAPGGANATEWATLVGWARRHRPGAVPRLVGVLTESAACTGPPPRACAGIDQTPPRAWAQLAAHGPGLQFATDIGYLPAGGRAHGPGLVRRARDTAIALVAAAVIATLGGALVREWRGRRRSPRRRRTRRTRRR